MFVCHVVVLTRVDDHVIELAFMIEPITLSAYAHAASPVGEDHPVRPIAPSPQQNRLEAHTIKGFFRGEPDSCQVGQGRQQIDGGGNLPDSHPRLDVPRPANQKGNSDAAFIGRSFAPLHVSVPAPAVRAIVAEVNDNGVVGQLQLVELAQDAAHVPVDVFTHGQCCPGHGNILQPRIPVAHFQVGLFELLPESVRHLHG